MRYLPDGPDVGQQRRAAGELVEVAEVQLDADAPGHGDQVDDGVGGAAEREHRGDRVAERRARSGSWRAGRPPRPCPRCAARCARAITACRESAAGIEAAPGSVTPSASAALVMVDAVPIVMQWPGERAMPFSISLPILVGDVPGPQVGPVLPGVGAGAERRAAPVPAQHRPGRQEQRGQVHRRRAHQQRPASSCRSRPSARRRRSGRSAAAPRSPSRAGCGRASSSASGTAPTATSRAAPAGIRPPDHTPRLTSSARCLKWVWQGLMSLQVLMIAITGLPR